MSAHCRNAARGISFAFVASHLHSRRKHESIDCEEHSRNRLWLGAFDRLAAKVFHAARPGVVTLRDKNDPERTKVIRVVLTGGPCAGKSSALEHVITSANDAGYDVYTCPEVATIFLNNGCAFPSEEKLRFEFQLQILKLQLAMERAFLSIACGTGRPSIMIYDRGLLDGRAYVDDATWQTLLSKTEASDEGLDKPRQLITTDYILNRYDMVIHLVTAAEGAEQYYKHGKTVDDSGREVYRGESLEEARQLDANCRSAWSLHPRHIIVGNGNNFDDKLKHASSAIIDLANHIQPQPKYLARRVEELERELKQVKSKLREQL